MYAKNIWKEISEEKKENIFAFNKGYIDFLSKSKTERLAAQESIRLAEEKGFKPAGEFKTLKPGDKVYFNNRGKNLALYVMGEKPVSQGLRILGAHIDSPRLDLQQNPLY